MDVQWQLIGRWAVTALPALVAFLGFLRGPGALRSKLRHDIEMLEKSPPDSAPHTKLLDYIDKQVARFAMIETESSRDWMGFTVALFVSGGLWAFALWAYAHGDWYWLVLAGSIAFVAVVAMSIMFDSAQRVPRDSSGKRIPA